MDEIPTITVRVDEHGTLLDVDVSGHPKQIEPIETPGAAPVADEEQELDEDDPGEVGTTFATKGTGWSGRDEEESDPGI
jgi:hypothetical protein